MKVAELRIALLRMPADMDVYMEVRGRRGFAIPADTEVRLHTTAYALVDGYREPIPPHDVFVISEYDD